MLTMGFTGKKACQLKAEYIKAFQEYDNNISENYETTEGDDENMEELATVNVRIENDQLITDSRNVAEVFGKQHGHVLRDIQNIQKDASNFGEMFFESTMPDSYGRQQRVYLMNRDGFTLLAMGFTGKDAMQWKLKYIDAFNRLEKAWNSPEAVMARALQFANERLEAVSQLNAELVSENAQQKQMLAEYAPKVSYYDIVLQTPDAVSISKIAKDYGKSATWFNKKLHEMGIQYKQGDTWLLYQKYAAEGYTRSKTHVFVDESGEQHSKLHTYWTQKGRLFLYEALKRHGVLPMVEQEM